MNNEMIESLTCPICLDTCNDPVESSCCKNLYCKSCSDELTQCSYCRKNCLFERSTLAKRLIDKIPLNCEHCKQKTTKGNLELHYIHCDELPICCPIESCKTGNISKSKIMHHILQEHNNEVKSRLNAILDVFSSDSIKTFSKTTIINQKASLPCFTAPQSASNSFHSLQNSRTSITIDSQTNSRGFTAKIGSSGKYYCRKKLDGPNCLCCDGTCGPTNGCNCSSCMELDLLSRGLPKGWLINSEGFPSRRGTNDLFYCGRYVLAGTPFCDGYCGPSNGPNCQSCQKLDSMTNLNGRYYRLI